MTFGGRLATPGRIARPGRIRLWGPLVALVPPTATASLAAVVWVAWPCEGLGCVTPSLLSWGLALLAVPTAVPAGLPWIAHPVAVLAACATSALLWVGLGRWAAARATGDVDATWPDYWRELGSMTAGVWLGLLGGVVTIAVWLSA